MSSVWLIVQVVALCLVPPTLAAMIFMLHEQSIQIRHLKARRRELLAALEQREGAGR